MRLLTLDQHGELSLIERFGKEIPQYAILSHTWGPNDEEVTYHDLITGTKKDSPGYSKIKFCVEQANRDRLQYSWVDTCCLDKANFSELSEAINSMFDWYRNAARCYVFLKDVSANKTDINDQQSSMKWETAFRNSKWFTRGWTLQELIAPSSVEFFSAEGTRLGDKESLEQSVQQITGIALQALRGGPLSQFDFYERMSWAAKRETTKEEDIAYSLLGLFEVSMPLIYGEGRKRAQARLYNAYKEFSEPSFQQSENNTVHWIVPFDRNPDFTGRNLELSDLKKRVLGVERTTKTVAITGLGGVGKTQLALELVYQVKDMHRNCSVFWIPATNTESLYQAYLETARQLGISGSEDEEKDVKRLVQEYLSKDSSGKWILVFDNSDDIGMWFDEAEKGQQSGALIDYLPKSRQGCVIFTTRDKKVATELAGKAIVEVQELSHTNALDLLQNSLVDQNLVKNSLPDATALLEQLTHLPLAIVQAAAYINKNGITLADYLSLLTEQEAEVVDLLSEEFRDKWRYRDIKNPVAVTWLVSFRQIRQRYPLAADYLSFMACVDPRNIPQSLLPPGTSRKEEMEAIGTLLAYSFVSRRPADLALDLHRLVHLATRNWLRNEGLLGESSQGAMLRLEAIFPDNNYNNRNLWRMYLPHVRYALESDVVENDGGKKLDLMWRYATCLDEDGRWNEAELVYSQVLDVEKKTLGADHSNTLISMTNLASTYWKQGRWEEAEQLELHLMETSMKKLGEDHPATLLSIANLASTYCIQGRWVEAENLGAQVLEIRKEKLGDDHPDTLISMANLAVTYSEQGRQDEAEKLKLQVMEISKNKLGDDHPDTLRSMANLAVTYSEQGRQDEAEKLKLQVMEISKKKLGEDHPSTLVSMANLAETYRKQGRWKEAEELGVQALEARKKKLGEDHPSTLLSMANLAETYREQGRWKEAEDLGVQTLEARKKKLGDDHPETLLSMTNLAVTYSEQGRQNEAEKLKLQVMEISKKKLGDDHPSTLLSMANLAVTHSEQGREDEAEKLELQVMEIRTKKLGEGHPSTLHSMANLASTYWKQGRLEEAEQLELQVMETRKKKLGDDHPDTLLSMANLAVTYSEQGREDETEKLELQVMEISKKKLGDDHPSTLLSIANLAETYRKQGRWKEAEELGVQALEARKKKLGDDHPSTLLSMVNLASTYWNQGRLEEAEQLELQVMETRKKKLGDDHPDTLTSMDNLAVTYSEQGRQNEAEKLKLQVMEIRKKKLGDDHPSTLLSIANLAETYRKQGRWKDAEELGVQVLEARKKKLGEDHLDTLRSMVNLASTYWNQGRWEEAELLELQVMETRKNKLGIDHPDTLISMSNLAITWKSQGRDVEALQLMGDCVHRQSRIPGAKHTDFLSSNAVLADWQTGQTDRNG